MDHSEGMYISINWYLLLHSLVLSEWYVSTTPEKRHRTVYGHATTRTSARIFTRHGLLNRVGRQESFIILQVVSPIPDFQFYTHVRSHLLDIYPLVSFFFLTQRRRVLSHKPPPQTHAIRP